MPKNTFRHSEEAIEQVENIVQSAEYLGSKSDFYQTVTDYALHQATDGEYTSEIDDFDRKVGELGLRQLADTAFEHFDFATTVHQVAHDESQPVDERMEYLQKLSEQEIKEKFPESNYADRLSHF